MGLAELDYVLWLLRPGRTVCAFAIQPGKPSPYPLTKEILEPLVEAGCKLFTG